MGAGVDAEQGLKWDGWCLIMGVVGAYIQTYLVYMRYIVA